METDLDIYINSSTSPRLMYSVYTPYKIYLQYNSFTMFVTRKFMTNVKIQKVSQ